MPSIRLSRETYDRLVAAFREQRNVARAAREAGCSERAALKAWRDGYDRPEWASVPIKKLLEDEQAAIRAKLAEEAALAERVADEHQRSLAGRQARYAEERERAKDDAARQQLDEALAVRGAMRHGQAILGIAGTLGQATLPIVQRAQALIGQAEPSNFKEIVELVTKIAWLGQSAVAVVGRAMELDRMRLGKPEKVLGLQPMQPRQGVVDGDLAVELLGSEEAVAGAIRDLVDGRMTEAAMKLLQAAPVAGEA